MILPGMMAFGAGFCVEGSIRIGLRVIFLMQNLLCAPLELNSSTAPTPVRE